MGQVKAKEAYFTDLIDELNTKIQEKQDSLTAYI
jgi:hypothetical protein